MFHPRSTKTEPASTVTQDNASAPSGIDCEYCQSRNGKWLQRQLVTLFEVDSTQWRAGDMVKVQVGSKGHKSRLEPAVIAETEKSSVFLVWLFETGKNKARKELLKGKVDPSHRLILSSHADAVSVNSVVRFMSATERQKVCTEWLLHSNAAQLTSIAELHDGCFMHNLVENVRPVEPSERTAAAGGAPSGIIPEQEPNISPAPIQKDNLEQADLQSAAISPSSSPVAHPSTPPDQFQSGKPSNNKRPHLDSNPRPPSTTKYRKLDASPSTVSRDPPGDAVEIHKLIPRHKDDPLPWVNDDIVDNSIEMLTREACAKHGYIEADKDSNNVRPYVSFNCHWWNRHPKAVLSSNKKLGLGGNRLLSVKHVFMPVCDANHWTLLVVSGQERTIRYLDSRDGPSEKFINRASQWVRETLRDAYNEGDWKIIREQLAPQQNENTVDCGVAVILNAWSIARGVPVRPDLYSFKRQAMLSVRHQLAANLSSRNVKLDAFPSATNRKKGFEDVVRIDKKPSPPSKDPLSPTEGRAQSVGLLTSDLDEHGRLHGHDQGDPDHSSTPCRPDFKVSTPDDSETDQRLHDTISKRNGILRSPPPLHKTTAKDDPAAGARSQGVASAHQRDQNAPSGADDVHVDNETGSTFREDRLTTGGDTNSMNEAYHNNGFSTLNTLDRPATGTKIKMAVKANSSGPRDPTDTRTNDRREQDIKHRALDSQKSPIRRRRGCGAKKAGLSHLFPHLGRRLREHSSQDLSQPIITDLAGLFPAHKNSARGNSAEQQSTSLRHQNEPTPTGAHRAKNPVDSPDSRPATPRSSWNLADQLPPKRVSTRKGVSINGVSRPAEVGEEDWLKMGESERRRMWNIYRIESEDFGQRAPHPCENCTKGSHKCWTYKDAISKSQQCSQCLRSHKSCCFVRKAQSTEGLHEEVGHTNRDGQNVADGPLDSEPRPSLWDSVIWVTFPDNYPFYNSSTLAIYNCPKDLKKLGHDTWWEHAPQSGLGDSAVWKTKGEGGTWVHQGLATMLAVQYSVKFRESFSVRLHEWDWLMGQLQKHRNNNLLSTCSDSDGQPQSTVIFIHATTQKPGDVQHVYEDIRMLRLISGAKFRVYPSLREWRRDQEKIEDIRTLDEIAKLSSRPEYSYRPKTCFGGQCLFQRQDITVLKRSHSEGGRHVEVLKGGVCGRLTCISDQPPTAKKYKREDQEKRTVFGVRPHWFHQEYVPALSRGEFRVFISTSEADGETSPNTRRGGVIAIAWTSWNSKKELHVVDADENHFGGSSNSKCGALNRPDLEDFCLYVFEELRARNRNSPYYESLEVGVRLDVGVADDQGQKRFFVNEISRWYNAHYFSYSILAKPYTKICKAFAEAFGSYVHGGMPDVTD